MVASGGRRGGSGPEVARASGRVFRTGTSRGTHVRALWECLSALIEVEHDFVLTERRVRLRTYRAMLERTYPNELGVNAVDLAQALAEEDGEPFDEAP